MTDELIALLKAAKTDEERKAILDKHAKELSDEDLDSVAGGCSSCTPDSCDGQTGPACTPITCLDEFVGPY